MIKGTSWDLLLFLILMCVIACNSDQLQPSVACETMTPTYESNIKNIIDQTCAYSGCHDGAGGIGPGNYKTYNGLEGALLSGDFIERTINLRDNPSRGMPPDNSVYPESQQDNLSEVQLEILKCWIQNGFPEN